MSLLRRSLLLSVLLVGTYGGLLGKSECTYGPSYWCHSISHAKQCSAMNHCIQTVWEHQVLPADNDDVCSICKDMVQQARDTLESNQTQEEIKAVFDGSCQLIPLREVASECKQLAEEFIPELIETLASQMNPQVVCATAGLCNSVRVDKLLREHGMDTSSPSSPNPGDCRDCNAFVKDVITLVRQHSKQELMDHLLAICGELGSVSDGCSALVTVNIDTIYSFLSYDLQPESVCSLFGMCSEAFSRFTLPDLKKGKGDEACDFCVVIAQHWRETLISNTTEQELVEVLQGICKQTGSFKGECLSLVDKYSLVLYDYLLNSFDPKELCEVVGICSDRLRNKPVWTSLHTGPLPADADMSEVAVQRLPIRPSLHIAGNDEVNSYRSEEPNIKVSVAGKSGVLAGSDEACTMCEFTLHFIQIQLQDGKTRDSIERAVKGVCQFLPKDLREQCQDYVDAYGDQVIALLQQEIDPSVLCPAMGLCPKNPAQEIPSKEVVTCVACEFIMKQLRDILQDKTDEESIKTALDEVCSILPHSLGSQCQTFVDQNAIEVMQLLAAGVDPEQVCRMLGLCHGNLGGLPPLNGANQLPIARLFVPAPQPAPVQSAPSLETTGQSKVCILCEFAMKALEQLVLDNSTHIESEIKKGMDIVCLHLPSTLQDDCLGFVDQYTTALVELLVSKATPQTVCREATLCSPPALSSVAVLAESTPVGDERSCLICKAIATIAMDSAIPDKDFKEAELDVLCDSLEGGERVLCLELRGLSFQPYSPRSQQCTQLGHCAQQLHLIGSERCTWGPSYWCQSLLHAKACGATPHCQDRVWEGGAPPA